MKKHIVWVVLVLFMLTACSATPEPTETGAPNSGDHACVVFPRIEDIDEYNKFISSSKWAEDDFVKWEDIAYLGEFRSFELIDEDEYWYLIGSGQGGGKGSVLLKIDHTPEIDPFDDKYVDVEMPEDMVSMRTVKRAGESGTVAVCDIVRNGFRYRYGRNGNILTLTWYHNGIEFKIGSGLSDYPDTGAETGIGRLLSASETEFNAVVAELRQHLNHETS